MSKKYITKVNAIVNPNTKGVNIIETIEDNNNKIIKTYYLPLEAINNLDLLIKFYLVISRYIVKDYHGDFYYIDTDAETLQGDELNAINNALRKITEDLKQ